MRRKSTQASSTCQALCDFAFVEEKQSLGLFANGGSLVASRERCSQLEDYWLTPSPFTCSRKSREGWRTFSYLDALSPGNGSLVEITESQTVAEAQGVKGLQDTAVQPTLDSLTRKVRRACCVNGSRSPAAVWMPHWEICWTTTGTEGSVCNPWDMNSIYIYIHIYGTPRKDLPNSMPLETLLATFTPMVHYDSDRADLWRGNLP